MMENSRDLFNKVIENEIDKEFFGSKRISPTDAQDIVLNILKNTRFQTEETGVRITGKHKKKEYTDYNKQQKKTKAVKMIQPAIIELRERGFLKIEIAS